MIFYYLADDVDEFLAFKGRVEGQLKGQIMF